VAGGLAPAASGGSALARIAEAFGCKPDDDDDLVEAARLLVRERDEAVAKAASGGGEGEPDCWAVENNEGGVVAAFTSQEAAGLFAKISDRWGPYTVVPRFRAPPQSRGWLNGNEREAVEYFSEFLDEHIVPPQWKDSAAVFRTLLARSSPPEVIRPKVIRAAARVYVEIVEARDAKWIAAISAAGVAVKEVGRE